MSTVMAEGTGSPLADGKRPMSTDEPSFNEEAQQKVNSSASGSDGSAQVIGAPANDQEIGDNKGKADQQQSTSSSSLSAASANQDNSQSSSSSSRSKVTTGTKSGHVEVDVVATGRGGGDSTPPIRRPSTTSRFKEKRPEPLKLNPNLNQDIPLDLSVKSAGNVPSGTLGSIFNLGQLNPLAPLETPRIQWQDNDSLLASAKNRLFSSSTNASQRARISSIIGESPPITPGTPVLMDVMFSSTGTNSSSTPMRPLHDPPHSASLALESPLHSFLTSSYDLGNRLQLLDRLSSSSSTSAAQQHQANKHLLDYQQIRADLRGTPRRSCSTDNLHLFMTAGGYNQTLIGDITSPSKFKLKHDDRQSPTNLNSQNSKKNSISPLATKSFSNRSSGLNSPTKFPYTNQQATDSAQQSPTSNGPKSLTPTSVANATVNLFNIHLNSPNSSSRQSPINSMLALNKFNNQEANQQQQQQLIQDSRILDVPSSVSYCQQQHQLPQLRRAVSSSSSTSPNGLDSNNNNRLLNQVGPYHRQQSNPSLSSTATLNTPTLISPSQMKAGQLCFLPSPTLSPMSSVFDLPSPFLMFAPASTTQAPAQQQQQQQGSSNNCPTENKTSLSKPSQSSTNQKSDASKKSRSETAKRAADRNLGQQQQHSSPRQDPKTNASQATTCSDEQSQMLTGASDQDRSGIHVIQTCETGSARNDLSQLITSADQKTACLEARFECDPNGDSLNHDIDMDIDDEHTIARHTITGEHGGGGPSYNFEPGARPSTVIPQICISKHHNAISLSNLQADQAKSSKISQQQQQESQANAGSFMASAHDSRDNEAHREQRDFLCKRSLSPKTFHARVTNYHNERLESSSAPPDVHQRRRRSKIKSAAISAAAGADSCFELADKEPVVGTDKRNRVNTTSQLGHENNKPTGLSQSVANLNNVQQHDRSHSRPYPEMRGWLTASNQQLETRSAQSADSSFLSGRSSSAEPAIYSACQPPNKTQPCPPPPSNRNLENTSNPIASQPAAGHLYLGQQSNSNCAQPYLQQQQQPHQHQPQPQAPPQPSESHIFHNANQANHHPHHHQQQHPQQQQQQQPQQHQHHQQHYHSLSNQQFQYQQQQQQQQPTVNYDHQQYNAQQLYSMSAGELHRLQYSRHGCPTNAPVANNKNDATLFSSVSHYNQPSNQQQQPFPPGHQNAPASLELDDSRVHRACERQFVDQELRHRDHHASNAAAHQDSIIRQMGLQPASAAAQLLCRRFEICNQPPGNSQVGMSPLLKGPGGESSFANGHSSSLACAAAAAAAVAATTNNSFSTSTSTALANSQQAALPSLMTTSRPPYHQMLNTDSRSESRSSCSMDFTSSPFGGSNGASRSNSAASSNLAAKKYHCDQCSKSFTRSDMLTRHRRLHSGDRPFQCTECKQEFSRSDHLSTHMRTHTGEKPYKCKLCTYSACRKDMITRHLKVHNRSNESSRTYMS